MNHKDWIFRLPLLGIVVLVVGIAAGLVVYYERRRAKITMRTIERMLEQAMEGDFTEEDFDESRLSALETKFVHYLSASAVSAGNVSAEKDKIKTLISDISHQTKTPIANLLLYSELLMEEELPESVTGSVEVIYNQAVRLRFLIDSLVKLSRLESGIVSLRPEENRIQLLFDQMVEQFARRAEEKGLRFRVKSTDNIENTKDMDDVDGAENTDGTKAVTYLTAVFDPKWTAEALGNVVDNAIKYTEYGEITISAVRYEMFVRIDVADTGIGIPEEEQAKIFSRFYRSEEVRGQDGVGIGLYLAREIISNEGGYMKVSSKAGSGAVFSMFLPRQ